MADQSNIEWTDATWNIVTGCSVLSPGCTNCYAMKLAGTRLKHHRSRAGLTRDTKAGPVWTGEVRFNEEWLLQPLQWKRPRMIFVCAHADLFHENVPDEWLDRIFAVMALAPQHVFQVLTKRPERMRDYLSAQAVVRRICEVAAELRFASAPSAERRPSAFHRHMASSAKLTAWTSEGGIASEMFKRQEPGRPFPSWVNWPLRNVWLGVSVEDQQRANERIPILLDTPAAVRWLSMEPLLGPVNLNWGNEYGDEWGNYLTGERCEIDPTPDAGPNGPAMSKCEGPGFDWIVLGGESGPGARPMHPDWARSVRDQCAAAGVPFHFKQWGSWLPWEPGCPPEWEAQNGRREDHHVLLPIDMDADQNWDDGLWAIPEHDHFAFQRVGKKAAGRLPDGAVHEGVPA